MRVRGCLRCGHGAGALRFGLLMLPALFWSAVFAALAGAGPVGSVLERAPDAAQLLVAASCPLLAALLGLDALRSGGRPGGARAGGGRRFAAVASTALFVFAVLAALRPS